MNVIECVSAWMDGWMKRKTSYNSIVYIVNVRESEEERGGWIGEEGKE